MKGALDCDFVFDSGLLGFIMLFYFYLTYLFILNKDTNSLLLKVLPQRQGKVHFICIFLKRTCTLSSNTEKFSP